MSVSISLADTDAEGDPETGARLRGYLSIAGFVLGSFVLLALYYFWQEEGPSDDYEEQFRPYFFALFIFALLWTGVAFGLLHWIRSKYGIRFPEEARGKALHEENFASGIKQNKLGGGQNCLRFVVTHDEFWMTSWFPFSCILESFDGEHRVKLSDVLSIQRQKAFWFYGKSISLTYQASKGPITLLLRSKKESDFLKALFQNSELASPEKWHLEVPDQTTSID